MQTGDDKMKLPKANSAFNKKFLSESGIEFKELPMGKILVIGKEGKADFELNTSTLDWKNKFTGSKRRSDRIQAFIEVYNRSRVVRLI